jgi:hypothetical protein
VQDAAEAVLRFIGQYKIGTLNVAGPRASGWREGYEFSLTLIAVVTRGWENSIR